MESLLAKARPHNDLTLPEKIARPLKGFLEKLSLMDLSAMRLDLDPEFEMEIHAPTLFPWIRYARGIEQALSAISHNFSTVMEQKPQIESLVAQGDVIGIVISETGKLKATGESYDCVAFQQYSFKQDKFARFLEVVTFRTPTNESREFGTPTKWR